MASMNFGMSSPYIEAFSIAKGAGAKVFSVIDRVSLIDSCSEDGKRPEKMDGNIHFRDVHFEYPTRAEVKVSTTCRPMSCIPSLVHKIMWYRMCFNVIFSIVQN